MIAVDRAATVADKTKVDEYVAEWREETRPCGPDLQAEAELEAARLSDEYPQSLVRSYIRNGGWAEGRGSERGDGRNSDVSESP